ncbi:ADP-heptose:LPS heptosyltransferase [Pedobacter sp. W3I1]|uniref:glycosyltransferase family 9 protein n=1 Tax=Pedobacter sp. W3I1 TaxID=3042291 RepID=UPI002788361B|nr:glycosyltransferase family 9 protein [Pedobacter sp. W3I1]MDQ0637845.1 ADP-heptose:LPS heptosyltransferase [Pedobacter sp. W3I1]
MDWKSCKHILVIRPDNMGDLLMSAPAIRALSESFGCKITLLTSQMAVEASALLPWIQEVICYDLPWVKTNEAMPGEALTKVIEEVKARAFDGCIVFNVSTQNPAPSLMIAFMAGIPLRAAYSRENLYSLLTHWLPDKEPYFEIIHQVERDLRLCAFIGAHTADRQIRIGSLPQDILQEKLKPLNLKKNQFFVFHISVSEKKRQYPEAEWIKIAKELIRIQGLPILLTGSKTEQPLIERVATNVGEGALPIAGLLNLKELAACIAMARAMMSVNSGPMHLAAATDTPVLSLYARTNPQHSPWMVPHRTIEFDVPSALQSNNQVLRYQSVKAYSSPITFPGAEKILKAFEDLLNETASR